MFCLQVVLVSVWCVHTNVKACLRMLALHSVAVVLCDVVSLTMSAVEVIMCTLLLQVMISTSTDYTSLALTLCSYAGASSSGNVNSSSDSTAGVSTKPVSTAAESRCAVSSKIS
jgi:hypothetical protein